MPNGNEIIRNMKERRARELSVAFAAANAFSGALEKMRIAYIPEPDRIGSSGAHSIVNGNFSSDVVRWGADILPHDPEERTGEWLPVRPTDLHELRKRWVVRLINTPWRFLDSFAEPPKEPLHGWPTAKFTLTCIYEGRVTPASFTVEIAHDKLRTSDLRWVGKPEKHEIEMKRVAFTDKGPSYSIPGPSITTSLLPIDKYLVGVDLKAPCPGYVWMKPCLKYRIAGKEWTMHQSLYADSFTRMVGRYNHGDENTFKRITSVVDIDYAGVYEIIFVPDDRARCDVHYMRDASCVPAPPARRP